MSPGACIAATGPPGPEVAWAVLRRPAPALPDMAEPQLKVTGQMQVLAVATCKGMVLQCPSMAQP